MCLVLLFALMAVPTTRNNSVTFDEDGQHFQVPATCREGAGFFRTVAGSFEFTENSR